MRRCSVKELCVRKRGGTMDHGRSKKAGGLRAWPELYEDQCLLAQRVLITAAAFGNTASNSAHVASSLAFANKGAQSVLQPTTSAATYRRAGRVIDCEPNLLSITLQGVHKSPVEM